MAIICSPWFWVALIGRLTSLTAGDPLVVLLPLFLLVVAAWLYVFVRRVRLLFRTRLREQIK